MWQRLLAAVAAAGIAAGCSATADLPGPPVDHAHLSAALTEMAAARVPPQRHPVSADEAEAALQSAVARIRPAAAQICQKMGVGVCNWHFVLLHDRSLNASAGPKGLIAINRGVFEYADNQEQIAMAIAHEIGHQSAHHVSPGIRQEREADYLSALILYRAGLDLDRARGFLVTLGSIAGEQTGAPVTHPAGPERLASWDKAVEDIKASNGALTRR
jgi:predicted Zn-dependent protease